MASCIDKQTKKVLRSRDLTVAPWNDDSRYMPLSESAADAAEGITPPHYRIVDGGVVREATNDEQKKIDDKRADDAKKDRKRAEKELVGEGGELRLRAVAEVTRRSVNQLKASLIPPQSPIDRRQWFKLIRDVIDEGIDRDNGE